MNRILLSAMFLGGTLAVCGQGGRNRVLPLDKVSNGTSAQGDNQPSPVNLGERAVFWSEDFSGGMPAGWTSTDVGTTAPDPLVTFVWTNDPTAVAAGALSWTECTTFGSTTASNGYLWANADRGLTAAPATNMQTRLNCTPIDCSGQNTVLLTMQSTIGVFDVPAFTGVLLKVSTDGVTWTDYLPHPCLDTPTSATYNPPCDRWSFNPDMAMVDITATAANQPVVYLQFQWNGGWDYYWAIDDMELSSVPDFGRAMSSSYLSHRDISEGWEFARVPVNQISGSMYMGANVINQGTTPQTNLSISGASIPAGLTASANFASLAYGDTASLYQTVAISPAPGTFTVNYSLTSDQDASEPDLTDEAITRTFSIDNDRYALDGVGVYPTTTLTDLGTYSFSNNDDGASFMTMYPLITSTTVYGLEALIADGSAAGSYLVGSIRDTLQVFDATTTLGTPIAESDAIDIGDGEIATGRVIIPFNPPVVLSPNAYFACVKAFSNGGTNDLGFVDDLTVPQPGQASFIHIPTPTTGGQSGPFSNGNAIAIRLLLTEAAVVGVKEQAPLEGVSLYPNPTNGRVTVRMSQSGNYTIEVMDLIGQNVHSTRSNGNAVLDLSGQAKGVYMVRVTSGDTSTVQRITLN